MREREALRAAKSFVHERYPAYADAHLLLVLEEDGARAKSWAFAVSPDEEDEDYETHGEAAVGYVHADGHVEGLYGANR